MDGASDILRLGAGLVILAFGAWCLVLCWVVVGRYLYARANRKPIKHSSMIGPGSLLIWLGANLSGLNVLSFVGWWIILIDPFSYEVAALPFYLLYRRVHRDA